MTTHTPEQARTLWCPMVRSAREEYRAGGSTDTVIIGGCNTDALGGNRVPAYCRCIADKCAMWRWASKVEMHQTERASIPVKVATDKGFCGIAGRPEVMA